MKSYTNLEQSKKLAEILPLESADMYYNPRPSNEIPNVGNANTALLQVPCWSLAALLDVIPEYNLQKIYCGNIKVGERIVIYPYDEHYMSDYYDNAVDACVSMIEYLHELKML